MVKRALRVKAERRAQVPPATESLLPTMLFLAVRGIQPQPAAPLQAGSVRGGADGSKPDAGGPTPPQHLQRKVLRRVRFLEKVAAARPVLAPRGGGARKRRGRRVPAKPSGLAALDLGLSSLAASLGEVERETAERASAPRKGLGAGGAKARSRITTSETERLRQVIKLLLRWACWLHRLSFSLFVRTARASSKSRALPGAVIVSWVPERHCTLTPPAWHALPGAGAPAVPGRPHRGGGEPPGGHAAARAPAAQAGRRHRQAAAAEAAAEAAAQGAAYRGRLNGV